jgi:predicted nucleic acid-binding protein
MSWLGAQPTGLVAISLVTFAELRVGALAATDDIRRRQLSDWIETTLPLWFEDRVLPPTLGVMTDWLTMAQALSGKRITRNAADLLIASTARVHGLTLVSRNVRDFAGTGAVVYDPWNGKTHRMDAL